MKDKNTIVAIVLGACVIASSIYSAINNKEFWNMSITSMLTLMIAIFVSFLLTQKKNDKMHKNEKIDRLVNKIQMIVSDENFILAEGEQMQRLNLLNHKILANKITQLKEICTEDKILKHIADIEKVFGEFREFYGEHYKDEDYMKKSSVQLKNYIFKIDNSCDYIHIQL